MHVVLAEQLVLVDVRLFHFNAVQDPPDKVTEHPGGEVSALTAVAVEIDVQYPFFAAVSQSAFVDTRDTALAEVQSPVTFTS
jgi:hypothetical protein